ncbi:DNA excision repair protein ERCC-6-like [Candoia aspera]|uniref:DNA excision repair protein ERCC-6-like n=1 Tax=Candoia aspera TaxID=51853 RepID=UPI002FD7FEDE
MLYGEMHDKLFEHQREGVAFLYKLHQDRRKGGILADDMGLGKTIQVIAFLSGMFDAELIRSVLIAVPTTLVNNWMKEFAKWTPGLRVKVFHGVCKAERNRSLERIQRRNGILLTTYQMILNNWQQISSFGGKEFVWDYIILDEAHKIKCPSAKTTKSVHAIPSKHHILLTGTPVQNNLKELWALFDFACQGSLLGTVKTFRMEYENPITRARTKDATPGEKALGLKISENLKSIIKPYFLRRTKDVLQKENKPELPSHLPGDQSKDVALAMPSLPRKNDFIVWVFLAPVQKEIYRNFLSLDHIKELLMSTRSPLAALEILKKLCDHPRLLSDRSCGQLGLEVSSYSEQEVGENEPRDPRDTKRKIGHISDEVLLQESGKLGFLVALLERLQEEGHRTLVFSRSRKMLDIIERILTHRCFKLVRIDGTVNHLMEREKRISMFQKDGDYSVFLLTTQVGGTGLTLTAASRVVIFDPSWNPATDAQAVDRAYRIGQKENVIIYRLITCGTVEEKIYRRQVFKDSLIRQSTGDKKNPYRYFTMQELRELFTLEDIRSSATQLQLQSLHATQRKTDTQLDEHIAYIHSLEIFGISDHDLMYTHEMAHSDEAENEEAHRYIEHRVQKAQELVELESQLSDQLMGNIRNMTEGAWLRDTESSTQPKKKPLKSSPSDTPVPSISEGTSPRVMESTTPSKKKSLNSPPSPVVASPVFLGPVISNEIMDPVSDSENDDVSDMANLSSKMTSLIIEDVAVEQKLQNISNMTLLPSEEKEHIERRVQKAQELVELESQLNDQLMGNIRNMTEGAWLRDTESSTQPKKKPLKSSPSDTPVPSISEGTSPRVMESTTSSKKKSLNFPPSPVVASPVFLGPVISNEIMDPVSDSENDDVSDMANLSSKMTSLIIEDVAVEQKLQNISNMTLLPSEEKEHIERRVQKAQELVELESQLNDQLMGNIRNMTEGAWLRDTESSTQPKKKPLKSSPSDTPVPSISEGTSPRVMESTTSSKKKSLNFPPSPVVASPVFIRPVISNEVIDLVSDSENDDVSDMANLSSKMTGLISEDVAVEQKLQNISNMTLLPSEEKEHKFSRFQVCELKHGIGPTSPFQIHSVSNKENYSPESNAIFDLPAKDTDDEQIVFHITNTDVQHSENKGYKPTRLQKDEQNESLHVVSSFPRALSLSVEGNINSESKMISCDPSPKARSELIDVQMKPLQQSVVYPSDDSMHQMETEMSLDVLPSSHGDACKINELDAVAPHETMARKMSESSALQKSGARETMQDNESLAISSSYPVSFTFALEDSEDGPQTISGKDMSLEETENEGFQLRLDSHYSSAAESVGGEYGDDRSLQTSKDVKGSVVIDNSKSPCDALMDSRESFGWRKKKPIKIIIWDDEEEEDKLIDDLDGSCPKEVSALNKPDGICMSTPKANRPTAEICFSPGVKVSGRRSTASQRSLFDIVLEEVEAAAGVEGSAGNVSYDKSDQHGFERQLTQNYIEQMSEELEEEPSGETPDSESEPSHFHDTNSSREKSFLSEGTAWWESDPSAKSKT